VNEFRRPQCVDDAEWEALSALDRRIRRAEEAADHALTIGAAKELCEAAAKTVWRHRGRQFGSRTDLSELVKTAQRFVDRLPPHGAAEGGLTRQLAQTATKLIELLGELRNRAGTGHGRPEPVVVDERDAGFAAGVARLWCSWLLAHLDLVVAASPERTAADFQRPSTFRRTEAAARLALANLPELEPVDQRMIGVAVGQRAASGTFVVFEEGVDAAIDSGDLGIWPPAYRAGVAEGLFLDRNGYLVLSPRVVGSALEVLRALPDRGVEQLGGLLQRVRKTDLARSTTADDAASVSVKLREAAQGEDEHVLRSLLKQLADTVEGGTETAASM
jgi:hypothetical protein